MNGTKNAERPISLMWPEKKGASPEMKKVSITNSGLNGADKIIVMRSASSEPFWRRPCGLQRMKWPLQYRAGENFLKKQGEKV